MSSNPFKKIEKEVKRGVKKGWDIVTFSPIGEALGSKAITGDTGASDYEGELANLTRLQAQMAAGQYNFWETDYKPWEQAQIQANHDLLPHELNANIDQLKLQSSQAQHQKSLIPGQTELAFGQIDNAKELLPYQQNAAIAGLKADETEGFHRSESLENARGLLPYQQNTAISNLTAQKQFTDQLKGLTNVSQNEMINRMNDAGSEVANQYANAESDITANSMRYGIGALGSNFTDNSLDKAKATAAARNNARKEGYNDEFNRTMGALGSVR